MKKLIISFAIVGVLSGCSQTQMDDFTNSVTNTLGSIVKVESQNDSDTTNQSITKQSTVSDSFTLTLPQDVDTVFAAMKSEFGFPSPSDLKRKYGEYQANLNTQDQSYYYETNPGSFYHIGNSTVRNNSDILNLNCKLQKVSKGTKISCQFWDGSANTKKELITRIKQAVN